MLAVSIAISLYRYFVVSLYRYFYVFGVAQCLFRCIFLVRLAASSGLVASLGCLVHHTLKLLQETEDNTLNSRSAQAFSAFCSMLKAIRRIRVFAFRVFLLWLS